ncbi:MAG: 3-deoxy-7-phosphoheptulonate synthase [Treponema sp.]|nr:3-deoxy-7-phosphoheptulonate synthase [Treponema sp.]
MVIVLKSGISAEEKKALAKFLGSQNFKTNEIAGEEKTIIAAVGRLKMDPREVEVLPGVERVIPISKPYKMASREFKPQNSVVEIPSPSGQLIRVGGQRIVAMAGPCAVESREQMMAVAKRVSESGATILRGGAYKPRTSPYSFQGLGEEGCKILKEAGDKYGLPVVTECVAAEYIPAMQKAGIDCYQVGARNMQNFEMLKRLGKINKPVILKRGLSATIEEWLMSAEYLLSSGCENVILCERGIRTYERATRNTLDLSAVPILRSLTHLPIIVDPSHALGIRDKVSPMAFASIAAGADGIIVEVHCNPDKALSDGPQSLYPEQFDKLMRDIDALAPIVGREVAHLRRDEAPVKISSAKSKKAAAKKVSAKKITVAFCGKRGAYAEQAITRHFDDQATALPVDSFREIFQSVLDGRADYGMVPIENSLAGSVYENYDNLAAFEDVSIVSSVTLRIQHALLGAKGATLADIKSVYSHPQGLAQCSKFLAAHTDWNKIDSVSTATAAKTVSEKNSKANAAIASAVNAKYYKLSVIEESIEDDPKNYTRFFVIAANHFVARKKGDKAASLAFRAQKSAGVKPNAVSFMFSTKNEPGSLYRCLGVFDKNKLNLTRLESRPVHGETWKYNFYADAELSPEERNVEYVSGVLEALEKEAQGVRLLGVYNAETR